VFSEIPPIRFCLKAPPTAPLPDIGEPVPRIDVVREPLAPKPAPTPDDLAGSVREALDNVQKARTSRVALLLRAATTLWHAAARPAILETRRGKATLAGLALVVVLLALSRSLVAPLSSVLHGAIRPISDRSYFVFEEDFAAAGLRNWTDPALLVRREDGLVELQEGLNLFRPSLDRAEYEAAFAGLVRRGGLGFVVRASGPENYCAIRFTWRGKGREKRSVLARYAVVKGVRSKEDKIVALPFELEENKIQNIQVAVRGNRITILVNGRGVDSFTEDRLSAGGIGFLADPGDAALVHSLAVSGNDDATGRAFAWVLGFGRYLGGAFGL
jgi:hypothetical protein